MKKHVLFIHGAGSGAYEADGRLVASLAGALGSAYDVRYPRMVDEDSSPAIAPANVVKPLRTC